MLLPQQVLHSCRVSDANPLLCRYGAVCRPYPRQQEQQQPLRQRQQQQQPAGAPVKPAARQQSRAETKARRTTAAAATPTTRRQQQPTGEGSARLTAAAGRRAALGRVASIWQSSRPRVGSGALQGPPSTPARASQHWQQQQQARRRRCVWLGAGCAVINVVSGAVLLLLGTSMCKGLVPPAVRCH